MESKILSSYHQISEDLFSKACVASKGGISAILDSLEETGLGAACLTGDRGEFLGVVTDGDLRRFLRAGGRLDSSAHLAVPKVPQTFLEFESLSVGPHRFNSSLKLVPVLEHGRVLALLSSGGPTKPNANLTMLLMAGGEGRRLLPITASTPKPLVRVAGKPLIRHAIENAQKSGVSHFVISIRHLGDQIVDELGDGSSLGVKLHYLHETQPLGTAGCLSLLDFDNLNSVIIVQNADVLTDMRFEGLTSGLLDREYDAAIATREHSWQNPFGVVEVENETLRRISEKPVQKFQVSSGIYAFKTDFLRKLELRVQPLNMPDLFNTIVEAGSRVICRRVNGYWRDVGNLEQLQLAEADLGDE